MKSRLEKMIAIPDYWHDYVNPKVDLRANPKQPCPFHHEQHGQSFSYRADKNYFSCFGACHVLGGDVVRLHMLNYRLHDYEEAERSLARLYGITLEKELSFEPKTVVVNDKDIAYRVAYAKACALAVLPTIGSNSITLCHNTRRTLTNCKCLSIAVDRKGGRQ